jgi:hypothetical protein
MTETKLTSKGQAEQLLKNVLRGKNVHEYFTEQMEDQILISGHPMSYWRDKFDIQIPTQDLTPVMARELDMRMLELNQEATFLWNTAMTRSQLIKHGNQSVFMGKFNTLVQEYKQSKKRLPAQGTLENLARFDNLDVEAALSIADIEVKFWKSILDHLGRCQSVLKNASLMISTEMKHLGGKS